MLIGLRSNHTTESTGIKLTYQSQQHLSSFIRDSDIFLNSLRFLFLQLLLLLHHLVQVLLHVDGELGHAGKQLVDLLRQLVNVLKTGVEIFQFSQL